MSKIIKKVIKQDKDKVGSQVVINVEEDNILIAMINQEKVITQVSLTYNQLCSLSHAINAAIDNHYQSYSNSMAIEKTQKIYIDDPIDW